MLACVFTSTMVVYSVVHVFVPQNHRIRGDGSASAAARDAVTRTDQGDGDRRLCATDAG